MSGKHELTPATHLAHGLKLARMKEPCFKKRPPPAGSGLKKPFATSADVHDPLLSLRLGRGNWLRRELEHRCFLALEQVSQQHHSPVRKFQGIMMGTRVVLIDLPKDGRPVIEDHHFPPKQTAWAAPGKLCSRKNANRRRVIFRRSKSDSAGIEVQRSQFLTDLSRTGLYLLQAIVAHAGTFSVVSSAARLTQELCEEPCGSRRIGFRFNRGASGYDSGPLDGRKKMAAHPCIVLPPERSSPCATGIRSPRPMLRRRSNAGIRATTISTDRRTKAQAITRPPCATACVPRPQPAISGLRAGAPTSILPRRAGRRNIRRPHPLPSPQFACLILRSGAFRLLICWLSALKFGRHEQKCKRLRPACSARDGLPSLRRGRRSQRGFDNCIRSCRTGDTQGKLVGNVEALGNAIHPRLAVVVEALRRRGPPQRLAEEVMGLDERLCIRRRGAGRTQNCEHPFARALELCARCAPGFGCSDQRFRHLPQVPIGLGNPLRQAINQGARRLVRDEML